MEQRKQAQLSGSPPHHRRVDPAVEERRRVIVALLRQHPGGLTAREIGEATGIARNLTASALSGLFTRGVLHKQGHRYVLAVQDETLDRYAITGGWKSEESFLVEPGEIGLAPLEEARDGIDQNAKGRLAQLAAGLAER